MIIVMNIALQPGVVGDGSPMSGDIVKSDEDTKRQTSWSCPVRYDLALKSQGDRSHIIDEQVLPKNTSDLQI